MTVPSFLFLGFAAAVAVLYASARSLFWRRLVLLVANGFFLLTFASSLGELLPFIGFLLAGFILARLVGSERLAGSSLTAVALLVAAFVWLKHYAFVPSSLLLRFDYVTVGLSYVFFRMLHLVIMAAEEPDLSRIGLAEYLNYTTNFTALVSGPIQSYEDYRRMTVEEPVALTLEDAGTAIERIIAGFFKFAVCAPVALLMQHDVAAQLTGQMPDYERYVLTAALVAIYPVFLFLNFSGYTSFVIGVARFLRIELPENFDRPFRAASFIDYWSRWHMSLSNWLKAHLYNPVLLHAARRVRDPRKLPIINIGALFLTFFVVGVWHGQTWSFFFFGILNGGGVAVNQLYRLAMQRRLGTALYARLTLHSLYTLAGRGLTFAWVAFTLLWFWSDWAGIGDLFAPLGAAGIVGTSTILVAGASLTIALLLAICQACEAAQWRGGQIIASPALRTAWATLMLMSILAVDIVTGGNTGEVVYKTF